MMMMMMMLMHAKSNMTGWAGRVLFELFEFSLWGISHLKGIISRSNRIYPRIFRNRYFTEEEKPWTVSLC